MKEGRKNSARSGSGLFTKAACFLPATAHCVIILLINPSLSPSPPLHGSPCFTVDTNDWYQLCSGDGHNQAASCFRAAQRLELLLFVLLYYTHVQLISRRNNYTGRSGWSEENAVVLSPELLSDHRSATALCDSRQVIPSLSASHFSQALQPVSLVHEVSWAAVAQH